MLWLLVASWAALMDEIKQAQENLRGHLLNDENSARIVYSPCEGEDIHECINYELVCKPNDYFVWFTTYIGASTIALDLIQRSQEEPIKGTLKLSGGKVTLNIDFAELALSTNEMDGGWILTLGTYERTSFLDVLTDQHANDTSISFGEVSFPLSGKVGDGYALVKFREHCEALNKGAE